MLGMVGDRACQPLLPNALSSSVLLCRLGWTLLADRSCRGADEIVGLLFAIVSELLRGGNGF